MGDETPEGVEFEPEEKPADGQWYVAMDAEVYGPADKRELTRWAAEGRIRPGAQAVRVGEDVWAPFHRAPGLEDIPLTPPPVPVPATYVPRPAPRPRPARPSRQQLSPCPHCGGQVNNVAPSYGWPWGFFQRSLKPQFGCAQCGRSVQYEELPPKAQAQVSRSVRNGAIGWFVVVIGLILFIALCVFAILAALRP
jgi:hypothetical protein